MTEHGLITASHVLNLPANHGFVIRRGTEEWATNTADARERVIAESSEGAHDYALMSMADVPGAVSGSDLEVITPRVPPVGRQVAYLGYPFGTPALTVSSGYVSAVEMTPGGVTALRIDGSVNRGNSGGPLIDVETGELIAIVTRAETGFLVEAMKQLQQTLEQNVQILAQAAGGISLSGVDIVDAIRASHQAPLEVSRHLDRSANVGIGYAFLTGEQGGPGQSDRASADDGRRPAFGVRHGWTPT